MLPLRNFLFLFCFFTIFGLTISANRNNYQIDLYLNLKVMLIGRTIRLFLMKTKFMPFLTIFGTFNQPTVHLRPCLNLIIRLLIKFYLFK